LYGFGAGTTGTAAGATPFLEDRDLFGDLGGLPLFFFFVGSSGETAVPLFLLLFFVGDLCVSGEVDISR
jgi:hypothetical protein